MAYGNHFRVLFPGGGLWFYTAQGYSEAGQHIYAIAKEMNDAGEYFPIWGKDWADSSAKLN